MEKVASKIAGWGVPGLVLVVAIDATGLAGAAAITTALAAIGPGGIVGGVMFLLGSGLILDGLAEWGVDTLVFGVIQQLYRNGETKESITRTISKLPLSKSLKKKLYWEIEHFKDS